MSAELRISRFVVNKGPDFIRPLSCGEHFFHLYAQIYPVHFSLCAEIEGAIASDVLRLALNRVRERHPILKAHIVEDDEFGTAFHASDHPIELETIAVEEDADWRPAVERELKNPMGIEAKTLLRATALCAPETTVIILTFCHAIADGMSGVWVLHDLMRALAGEQLEACQFSTPLEEKILGASPAPARGWPAHASEADPIAPILPEIRSTAPIVPDNLRTNIVTAEFSREETVRLLERCRANGTTLHGLICAVASRHVPVSDENIVRMVCPIDLRHPAGIENGVCGVFIGVSSVEVPIGGTTSIWHDARHIVRTIARSRSTEAVIDFMSRMSAEFPPTARSEKLRTFLSAGPQSSLVVSNLGVLPIAERYGPYVVKAVWGPAMLTNLPEDRQTLGVSTFGDQLRIVHQSYAPIAGLVPAIRNSLLSACG
jgi:hypothetical protein